MADQNKQQGNPKQQPPAASTKPSVKVPDTKASVSVPESTSSTVIGKSLIIKGKLRSGEDLVIRGRIEADITSEKALFVENSGIVKASVRVRTARISGIVVGDVLADEKIEIASDGRVVGDLTSPRIVISDGAAFRGKIEMPNAEEMQKKRQEAEKDAPTGPTLAKKSKPSDIPTPPDNRKGPNRSPSTNGPAASGPTSADKVAKK